MRNNRALRKTLIFATLICFTAYSFGCSSIRQIAPSEVKENVKYIILKVVTVDDETIEFRYDKGKGGAVFKENHIVGIGLDDSEKSIPITQVKIIHVKQGNIGKSFILVFVTFFAIASIGAVSSGDVFVIFER
ncbi:hypothetical protein ACFL6O_02880 [candidate division KSB1 bacterium]